MKYTDLKSEDRISKAAEYATILIDEGKLEADIVKELTESFSISEEEAVLAIIKMKSDFSNEYLKSVNSNIWKAFFGFIISVSTAILIYGASSEGGVSGYFPVSIFFGIVAIGSVWYLLRLLFQKYQVERTSKISKEPPALFSILFIGILFFFLSLYVYKGDVGIIDEQKIEKLTGQVISEEVIKGSTGGRSKSYYYEFRFKNKPHKFRLFSNIYSYSIPRIGLVDFKVGDTVSVQILKKDLNVYDESEGSKKIDIVNITIDNRFVVDHKIRNSKVKAQNKRIFEIVSAILVMIVLGIVFWIIYKRKLSLE